MSAAGNGKALNELSETAEYGKNTAIFLFSLSYDDDLVNNAQTLLRYLNFCLFFVTFLVRIHIKQQVFSVYSTIMNSHAGTHKRRRSPETMVRAPITLSC